MPLSPGTRLGSYEIVAPLVVGGMGEVYGARDTILERDVVLKVLPAAFARDPERMARFQREAELLASLNHPNIAIIHGVVESDGQRALAMELVPGETLGTRIQRGAMPASEALPIARQIAEALEEAHERGVVRRDLKPGNVMITPTGSVKVLDLGLAAIVQGASSTPADPANSPTLTVRMTQAGVIKDAGTRVSTTTTSLALPSRRAWWIAVAAVLGIIADVAPVVEQPLESPRNLRLSPDGRRLALTSGPGATAISGSTISVERLSL